ncbi:sugar ABC transporter ATP-binding protein [Ruegeria sp. Ofav3-42]|uniref:sugar ABC transporter ATP-binding protein n=1 Tax=Ruegeria sp. Ofav3-42 TaxID=2917759 RepID=UPI001EF6FDFB|nr:sugar ABC transporter ATP-binding protein [Ruegeria sp. Ofav3-42]MCG7522447.1 sugar ABC transporter ATP-binding protein [Ruegeria sp. Ofav3-42]
MTRSKQASDASQNELLRLTGITKRFPGVLALSNVNFDLKEGEVHVLFGENGAGKSTLINVISGVLTPSEGAISLYGQPFRFSSPQDAREQGISPVFQEFSLIPDMTVEENLYLGREETTHGFLRKKEMRRAAMRILARLGFGIAPNARVSALPRAQQQMVEIAKALVTDPRILILDEPTASLTEAESARLFEFVRELRAQGVGIIYISHRMREIRDLADRVTVLRDGALISTVHAQDVTDDEMVELMTGRKAGVLYPRIPHNPGNVMLEARDLHTVRDRVRDASFQVRAGEIVGIAGLVGCGKSELVRAAFGLEPIDRGEVQFDGDTYAHPTAAQSLEHGICYFPADRGAEGLAATRPILENASMAALPENAFSIRGFLRKGSEKSRVQEIMERLQLRPMRLFAAVGSLSGGNRQKVVLARGMTRGTQVFLFDEPTVGIDVGAKAEIYALLGELVAEGAAVVLVSSELPEILGLSHRVYVMHNARVVAHLEGDEITEDRILSHFFTDHTDAA